MASLKVNSIHPSQAYGRDIILPLTHPDAFSWSNATLTSYETIVKRILRNVEKTFRFCPNETCPQCINKNLPNLSEVCRLTGFYYIIFSKTTSSEGKDGSESQFQEGLEHLSDALKWAMVARIGKMLKDREAKASARTAGQPTTRVPESEPPTPKAPSLEDRAPESQTKSHDPTSQVPTASHLSSPAPKISFLEETVISIVDFFCQNFLLIVKTERIDLIGNYFIKLTRVVKTNDLKRVYEPLTVFWLRFIDHNFELIDSYLTVAALSQCAAAMDRVKTFKTSMETLKRHPFPANVEDSVAAMQKCFYDLVIIADGLKLVVDLKNFSSADDGKQRLADQIKKVDVKLWGFRHRYPEILINFMFEAGKFFFSHLKDRDLAILKLDEAEKLLSHVEPGWAKKIKALKKKILTKAKGFPDAEHVSVAILSKKKFGLKAMVEYIVTMFPPIHIYTFELRSWEESFDKLVLDKKGLINILKLYHTDKVDREKFNAEYLQIVSEIGKILGGELAELKNSST